MIRSMQAIVASAVVFFPLARDPARGAEPAGGELKPFVLPWDDATPGPTDLSFLNHKPAGKFGPIRTGEDGHFHAGSERVRFLGVNLCFAGTLPEKDAAEKIAARMAKFGINVVRFHHMDGGDFPGGLIRRGARGSGELEPEALERLDYFISRLKAHGIYANINLLVSRRFRSGDGLPAGIDRLDWKLRHAVAMFHPPMIELQKQYARDLLGRRNPHTSSTLAADPAVAFVEINNENGLLQQWFGGDFDDLPSPFAEELARQWNAWLKGTYADSAALLKAWQATREPPGEEMLSSVAPGKALGAWNLERHAGAAGALRVEQNVAGQQVALRAEVERLGAESWHVQLTHPKLSVRAGRPYTLTFRARAEPPRAVNVGLQQDHDPWGDLGLSRRIELTGEWREHRFTFTPSADDGNARIRIGELGRTEGSLWLSGVSLRPGGEIGPTADETLESGSLPLIARSGTRAWPEAARRDFVKFLRDAEHAYWRTMRRMVKEELGFRGIVMGTIVGCSPPTVQAEFDAVDGHAYWQHPHFPNRAWDPEDWTVRNVSMVNEPGGVLAGLSMQRVEGKPFTVTEYNHSAPNSFGSEGPLLLAVQAAFQDWDGIYLFAYSHSTRWDSRRIDGFFDISQDPAKMANLAAAALIFRRGQVSPARESVVRDLAPERELDVLARNRRTWNLLDLADLGVPRSASLLHRTAIRLQSEGRGASETSRSRPAHSVLLRSDTGEVSWDLRTPGRGRVTVHAPRARIMVGYAGERPVESGEMSVAPAPGRPADWFTLCLCLLEGDALGQPGRALLIATGRVENTNMQWKNAERSSVGRRWGEAPTRVEVVPAVIRLPWAAARLEVWSLDERGQRAEKLLLRDAQGGSSFTIGEHPTLWYEVVAR